VVPFVFLSKPDSAVKADDHIVRVGADISTRDELLDQIAIGLRFPEYFGRNWDALDECLRDLHWIEAMRIVIVHDSLPSLSDNLLRIYIKILARAVQDWRQDKRHEVIVVFPANSEAHVREILDQGE
jgi:RNAse (barnase) inhibitor barstar